MPYQIKNGIIYSGNAVTLTQAQYDALTTAEKNNGTVYYIYDSDAMIEAQEVGLDGGNVEDLAGSVATFETSPATANHEVGEYILWNGVLYTVTSAIATGENLVVNSNISATTVGEELTALNAGLIEHYSTSEIVTGEWVDGKPVYKKTFVVTSGFSSGMTISSVSSLNIDVLVSIIGTVKRTNGTWNTVPNSNVNTGLVCFFAIASNNLLFEYGTGIAPSKVIATIEYTKTTD